MTDAEKLVIYVKALNAIQDYFEYSFDSKVDKDFVYGVLNNTHTEFMAFKK